MGKHQALFVHPGSHPRIDAITLAADGRRKTRPVDRRPRAREVGVGWTLRDCFGHGCLAPLHVQRTGKQESKERVCPLPRRCSRASD